MSTNSTALRTPFYHEELRNPLTRTTNNPPPLLSTDDAAEPDIRQLSSDSEVRFQVQEHNFQTLVPKLLEFERRNGYSSIQMFSQYLSGSLTLDEATEDWLDMFILFLGTDPIRRFACP